MTPRKGFHERVRAFRDETAKEKAKRVFRETVGFRMQPIAPKLNKALFVGKFNGIQPNQRIMLLLKKRRRKESGIHGK